MGKYNVMGHILFWATLVSPILAFSLVCCVGEADIFGTAGMLRYAWVMWLFVPLGIASIVIGCFLKKAKLKYRKNFVVAIICIPLLLLFGSYGYIFSGNSYDPKEISRIESIAGVDLPNQVKITTTEEQSYIESYAKLTDRNETEEFERSIGVDVKWSVHLSDGVKRVLPIMTQAEVERYDFFLFYNIADQTYNQYPPEGKVKYVFIAYRCKNHSLMIVSVED